MAKSKILVIDDEIGVRETFHNILKDDYEVTTAEKGSEGLSLAEKEEMDLIFLDMVMPEIDGIEVLRRLKQKKIRTPVVIVTATKSIKSAVEAMKLGAFDYLSKPFELDEITMVINRALESQRLMRQIDFLRQEIRQAYGFDNIIGKSKEISQVLDTIVKVSQNDATVLITGESGTGKELVARAIHSQSMRKDAPFVVVQCAAIPENLLESELFGHEKGAFTDATARQIGKFELADAGTLFLDEIGEMTPALQAKLLRVLEGQEFNRVGGNQPIKIDIRIICATNRDLKKMVSEGGFRDDLFYRINVVPIHLAALRERRTDIPLLVSHFLNKKARELHAKARNISSEALRILESYPWPGNVRELENIIERTLTLCDKETIQAEDLPSDLSKVSERSKVSSAPETEKVANLEEATRNFEKQAILSALNENDWVISRAAEKLGTTRRILAYKIEALGLKKSS